jgi:hypothetical protein
MIDKGLMSQEWITFVPMGRIEMEGWASGREVRPMQCNYGHEMK